MSLKAKIEAVLYLTDKPLRAQAIAGILGEDLQAVRQSLLDLIHEYEERQGGLEIADEDGYSFQVRDQFANLMDEFLPIEMSAAQLRTLSAIAIKQPISQSEIIRIRGQGAYEHIKELVLRGLISKREDEKMRSPLLSTTKQFQEYFRLTKDGKSLRQYLKREMKKKEKEEPLPPPPDGESVTLDGMKTSAGSPTEPLVTAAALAPAGSETDAIAFAAAEGEAVEGQNLLAEAETGSLIFAPKANEDRSCEDRSNTIQTCEDQTCEDQTCENQTRTDQTSTDQTSTDQTGENQTVTRYEIYESEQLTTNFSPPADSTEIVSRLRTSFKSARRAGRSRSGSNNSLPLQESRPEAEANAETESVPEPESSPEPRTFVTGKESAAETGFDPDDAIATNASSNSVESLK